MIYKSNNFYFLTKATSIIKETNKYENIQITMTSLLIFRNKSLDLSCKFEEEKKNYFSHKRLTPRLANNIDEQY